MKRPIFQVHGPPEKRRYFYGTLLIILGSFSSVFIEELIGLSLICIGFWISWHALRLGNANNLPTWMKPLLFIASVVTTGGLVVLAIGYILGAAGIIDF
ncbi:MAG: hypothetical protein OXM61_03220 [Candidatus Poribacteria bacterium]|nr:hypothetical protein [Candidatus Poribacteria bacterium]